MSYYTGSTLTSWYWTGWVHMMGADAHILDRVITGPDCNDTIARDIQCILDISRSYLPRPLSKHNHNQGLLFTQISGHSPIKILKVLNILKLQDNFSVHWYEFFTPLVHLRPKCPVTKFGQQNPCITLLHGRDMGCLVGVLNLTSAVHNMWRADL